MILPAEEEMVKRSRVQAYKLLSWENPASVGWLRAHGVDLVMVRLMLQGEQLASPASAWAACRDAVHGHYAAGVRLFELHNEPNLIIEGGCGARWKDGAGFAKWLSGLSILIKAELPDALLGWPGLSPGGAMPDFRQPWRQFLIDAVNVGAMSAVDWVGCHCYWQTPQGIKDPNEGAHWREYQRFGKGIFITEFSNPAEGVDKAEKARQYLQFVSGLDLTVRAAFAFVSSASGGEFPHETWTNEMADIVGKR
jgi:hypothetical protein